MSKDFLKLTLKTNNVMNKYDIKYKNDKKKTI